MKRTERTEGGEDGEVLIGRHCHPERSEGSCRAEFEPFPRKIPRCARDDSVFALRPPSPPSPSSPSSPSQLHSAHAPHRPPLRPRPGPRGRTSGCADQPRARGQRRATPRRTTTTSSISASRSGTSTGTRPSFDGRVTTTLVALRPGLDSVVLDMGRTLEVAERAPRRARLRPPERLPRRPPGAARRRSATPSGSPWTTTAGSGRATGSTSSRTSGRPHRPQQVYSGGGTDGNPRWLPTWGGPADKATWELVATVPGDSPWCPTASCVSDRPAAGGHAHDAPGGRRSRPRPTSSRSRRRRS